MPYVILILLILLTGGCGNQGLSDTEPPELTGVSIETNSVCRKGGSEVPCLQRGLSSDVLTVNVRITGSDDIGIAGYYISSADSLIPATLINIFPTASSYDDVIKFNLTAGDGIKTIRVSLQDQSGKVSDTIIAGVLVVSGQTVEWKKESIDVMSDFEKGLNSHALFIDDNGNPSIVYGYNQLFSAVSDTSGWTIEKVAGSEDDVGNSFAGTFIAADKSIHRSYIDKNNNLIYATDLSGSWITVTVDSSGSAGGPPDITQGPGGTYISYYDSTKGFLRYAVCASDCGSQSSWEIVDAGSSGSTGRFSSVKAGTDGSVHIVYFDTKDKSLKYITADSAGVLSSPETVDSDTGTYTYNATSLDLNNKVHIAYFNGSTGMLKYATNASGSWVVTGVDGEDTFVPNYVSVSVDTGGSVHIAYLKSAGLKYASNKSGSWETAIIDKNGGTGLYNRIVAGSDQKIHLSYFDDTNKAVRYAVCSAGCTDSANWKNVRVSSSGDAGRYNSIYRDSSGKTRMSYIAGKDLRYAENSTGGWRSAIIDKVGTPGECSNMAVDSSGNTHIVCSDMENKLLGYAVCKKDCIVPENWTSVVVDKGVTAGFSYVSLAVDADGGLNVSYRDIESGSLKYAYCGKDCTDDKDENNLADNWKKIFIDKIIDTDRGLYSSIAAAGTGTKKYISYYNKDINNTNGGDLKVAVCESDCTQDSNGDNIAVNWKTETIDEGKKNTDGSRDATGLYTSVRTDKDGDAHISYFNQSSGDLMYATNKSGKWVKTAVDKYDRAGVYAALTIDADDKTYIVYYRYSAGLSLLKYAVCASGCTIDTNSDGIGDNWNTYILDGFDNEGVFASITADSQIHIAYYDSDTGGLNYTFSQ